MKLSNDKLANTSKNLISESNKYQNLRKTYFRFRQTKQSSIITNRSISPTVIGKKHIDFYSHQKAVLAKVPAKASPDKNSIASPDKKFITTNHSFFKKDKMVSVSSIETKNIDKTAPLRRTFFSTKPDTNTIMRPDSSKTQIQRRTSINFRTNQVNNQDSNNYLSKYQILKELGKGTFSVVHLAKKRKKDQTTINQTQMSKEYTQCADTNESNIVNLQKQMKVAHKKQQELVAIKVYQKFKMSKDPSRFKNIRKEINIMQNLQHEGIVKYIESAETLTKISIVVQYGGDQSLLDYLKQNYPLEEYKLKDISLQLIKAINYMHQKNIVHRDIKLQNILIKDQQVKLIDFGFSCLVHKNMKLNAICGTPNYMAPEIISKKEYFGQNVDVWSYGVVVFALAQGRHPFKAQTYSQLQRLINRGRFQFKRSKNPTFIDFIKRILKVKPSDRPTASEIMQLKWLKQI